MAEGTGLGRAIWRFFTFYALRKRVGLTKAADEMFTGSVDGIEAAYTLQQDQLVEQYKGLRDAVSQVEMITEQKRQQLEKLNEEEADLITKRDGALTLAEQSAEGSDEYAKHAAAFERFQTRIDEVEQVQARLEQEIEETSQSMKRHLQQLTDLQSEIQRLPQEKAEMVAQHISSTELIQLNDRLQGIQTSLDTGPIDAVRKANAELSAKARISEKLAGTDVAAQDAQYARAGHSESASSKMQEMLAARKAEREGASEESPKSEDDRPEI